MKQPKLNEFKAWVIAHKDLATRVCLATAMAQCERERVDAYITPIFQAYAFERNAFGTSGPVKSVGDLYLCEDPRLQDFYAACDRAHREHGFTGPDGHCPALTAEDMQRRQEQKLIEAGTVLFGIEGCSLSLEHRAKMLDLLLGACLKEPEQLAA